MTTYTIEHCASGENKSGLTFAEVVQYIYRDDGQDYRLEPVLEESGQQEHLPHSPGILVWRASFRSSRGDWKPSQRLAFGETEEKAEDAFLLDSWNACAWNADKWHVSID